MKITKKDIIKHNVSRVVLLLAITVTPFVASAQNVSIYASFGGGNAFGNSSAGSAASSCTQQSLCSLVTLAIGYFNQAIYLIIALAVVTFVWNVYRYFIISDPENKKEASKYVMFSVIGLFVILSFWGLVNIVSNTLNLDTTASSINVQSLTGSNGTSNTTFTPNSNVSPGQKI